MDGPLNLLDGVLLALLVYVVVRGFLKGALSQLATFGGAVLGLVAGAWVAPGLARLFVAGPGPTLALVTFGLLVVAVIIGQGIGLGIGMRLRRAVERLGVGPLDRVAGLAVGAAGLIIAVWLLSSVLAQGPVPRLAQQVRGSRVVAVVHDVLPPPPDLFGPVAAYLDNQGFPQVFAGPGGVSAPPVPPTSPEAARAAADAGRESTVQVQATGCGGVSYGSGFVTQPGFVVTNAHVVAGGQRLVVRDLAGEHAAEALLVDSDLDVAVLAAPGLGAPALGWVEQPVERGVEGATLGFPGGQPEMVVKPATVRARGEATGRDIYGRGRVSREVLDLSAGEADGVQRGDSGGPFVTEGGRVGGVVFAADAVASGSGYALSAGQVRAGVDAAIAAGVPVDTGACRF